MALGLLTLLVFTTPGFSIVVGPEPDGFRGIKWGTNVADIEGLKPLDSDGPIKFYERDNDPLKIGSAALKSVNYGFYKDQFMMVTIDFSGKYNYQKIKEAFKQLYGTGQVMLGEPKGIDFWNLGMLGIEITIIYNKHLEAGSIRYEYKTIMDDIKRDQANEEVKDR